MCHFPRPVDGERNASLNQWHTITSCTDEAKMIAYPDHKLNLTKKVICYYS
jgi:hypothetical protein